MFAGTGAHGAYHAGVLRALQDAGIKVDVVAGHGIGAGAAALAAIDGASRLWDATGIWASPLAHRLYGWKPTVRVAAAFGFVIAALLAVPFFVLSLGLIAYPIGFLLTLVGLGAGPALTAAFSGWLQSMFAPEHLPTALPRLVMLAFVLLCLSVAGMTAVARWRAPARRRSTGGWWWDAAGAPLDASGARGAFLDAIWQLIRGAAGTGKVEPRVVGRRYAEVLAESAGQPGFRELVTIATDIDARRDIVVAFLREPHRSRFLAPIEGRDRRAEVLDVTGHGREHALDVIGAALTPPVGFDPALVTFGPESYWRGETHRLCDRPEALSRLVDELDTAGVRQLILVSGLPAMGGPHRLSPARLDARHRLGDYLLAAESLALEQALALGRSRFEAVYVISPAHNPLGPFDLAGVYDEASDRRHGLNELMDHGYSDAHRQFIEPVVGASGEQFDRAMTT